MIIKKMIRHWVSDIFQCIFNGFFVFSALPAGIRLPTPASTQPMKNCLRHSVFCFEYTNQSRSFLIHYCQSTSAFVSQSFAKEAFERNCIGRGFDTENNCLVVGNCCKKETENQKKEKEKRSKEKHEQKNPFLSTCVVIRVEVKTCPIFQ